VTRHREVTVQASVQPTRKQPLVSRRHPGGGDTPGRRAVDGVPLAGAKPPGTEGGRVRQGSPARCEHRSSYIYL
jgi:hypothetical protein